MAESFEIYSPTLPVCVAAACSTPALPLQESERLVGEARLLAKSLTADVERLTREKKDLQDRGEATKVGVSI